MFPPNRPPNQRPPFTPASVGRGPHIKVQPSAALGAMRKGTVEESVIDEVTEEFNNYKPKVKKVTECDLKVKGIKVLSG
jgi:hypothetical protein